MIFLGASGGIGAATAKLFTRLGAFVSLTDIDGENLVKVANECEKISANLSRVKT